MKIRLIIFVLFLYAPSSYSCPSLEGVWKSSLPISKKFNISRAKIEKRTREFRDQIIGKSSTTYVDGIMTITFIETPTITIEGKESPWDSSEIVSEYKILGCTKNQLVLKWSAFHNDFISTLNFESENTYWIYEGMPNGTGNDHTREYFVREHNGN